MSCDLCRRMIVGRNYDMRAIQTCNGCGCGIDTSGTPGTYLGLKGGYHVFRTHPIATCPSCGMELSHLYIECLDDLDAQTVNREINKLFDINQEKPHE